MPLSTGRSLKSLLSMTSNNKVAAASPSAGSSEASKKKKCSSTECSDAWKPKAASAAALPAPPPYERHSALVSKHSTRTTSSHPTGAKNTVAKIPRKRFKPPPPSKKPARPRPPPPHSHVGQSGATASGRRWSNHRTNTCHTATATASSESDRNTLMSLMVQDVSEALLPMKENSTDYRISLALHGKEKYWNRISNLSSEEFDSIWIPVQERVWKNLGIQPHLESSKRRVGTTMAQPPPPPPPPRPKTTAPHLLANAGSEGSSSRHDRSQSSSSTTAPPTDTSKGLLHGVTKSTAAKRSGANFAVSGVAKKMPMDAKANLVPTTKSTREAKDKQSGEKIGIAQDFNSEDPTEDMAAIQTAAAAFSAGDCSTAGSGVPPFSCHKRKRMSEQEAQTPSKNDDDQVDGHCRVLKNIVKDLRGQFLEGHIYAGKSSQETMTALQEAKAKWRSQLTEFSDAAFGTLWEKVAQAMMEDDDDEPAPKEVASVAGPTGNKTPSAEIAAQTTDENEKEKKEGTDWSFLVVGKNYDPSKLNMEMWDTIEELPVVRLRT